jgi:hypothetical protein
VFDIARHEPIRRRLPSASGVDPLTGPAFLAAIDQPERFGKSRVLSAKADAGFASESTIKRRNLETFRFNLNRKVSRDVGARPGLTPRRRQSGETDVQQPGENVAI